MEEGKGEPASLDNHLKSELIVDMLTRLVVHYNFWFTCVRHRTGLKKALEIVEKTRKKSISIGLKRMYRVPAG